MKELIAEFILKALRKLKIKKSKEWVLSKIEIPPNTDFGDFAFPCYTLVDEFKISPDEIALLIRKEIKKFPQTEFDDILTEGPYINFFIDRRNKARELVWEVINKREDYGKTNIGKRKKIVIDFSSPNIAKPFGIGHLRSTIIGNSLAKIYEFLGYKVIKENYLGDWGTQFGKIIFAYKKWGNEKELKKSKKPLEYLMKLYSKVNKDKRCDEKAREWFKKMEEGDKEALTIWRLFKELSLKELERVYERLGIEFDIYGGESLAVRDGYKIIEELKEKKIAKKSQGALIVNLEKEGKGVCIIQKSDGTTTYALRDISTAIKRYKKYKFEKMIYEVGQEQKLHFKQIFRILELMGNEWAKKCLTRTHGLYLGKDGKKMSTRKGDIVLVEELVDKTKELAKKEIKKREPKINKKELEERAEKIAIAAIFYGDLKNNPAKDVVFDLKKFVSFEGNTGPYILYSYARASSIIRKAGKIKKDFVIKELKKEEFDLVNHLSKFNEIVLKSAETMNPSIIANFVYESCRLFNEFYQTSPVIDSENEVFRLALVESFRQVIRNALKLLGIETIEKM